jgi:hypothetical protein
MALASHISSHPPPLCLPHNPEVAGANPAPKMHLRHQHGVMQDFFGPQEDSEGGICPRKT